MTAIPAGVIVGDAITAEIPAGWTRCPELDARFDRLLSGRPAPQVAF